MATITYVGKARTTAQVSTYTVVSGSDTTTYTLTCNGKTATYTASAGNNATVIATALAAAWALREEPEFTELTLTDGLAGVLTITGPDTGKPFTVTASVSGGAGTLTAATPTAASSPYHLNKTANYSGAALPVNGDVLVVEDEVSILWELDALTSITFQLDRRASHAGRIGLPPLDEDGGYPQYRPRHLESAATTHKVRQAGGDGPYQVRLKSTAGSAVTLTVTGDGAADEILEVFGLPASSVLNVAGSGVAVAPLTGQTATVATLLANNAAVRLGAGVTLTTATLTGGSAVLGCGWTTLNMDRGAQALVVLAAAGGTTNADDGAITWRSTGNLGTVVLGTGAFLDLSGAPSAVTVTALTLSENSGLTDPAGRITRPYDLVLNRTEIGRVSLDVGTHRTITVDDGP